MDNNIYLDFSNDSNANFFITTFGTSYILTLEKDELSVKLRLSFKQLDMAMDTCREMNGEPTFKELEDKIHLVEEKLKALE